MKKLRWQWYLRDWFIVTAFIGALIVYVPMTWPTVYRQILDLLVYILLGPAIK